MPAVLSFTERVLRSIHFLPTPVMDAFGAVIFARALTVGLRRGLFESLAWRRLTIEEISRETGLTPEGTRLLAEACVAGGYIEKKGEKYSDSAEGRKWLVRSSETYLGDLLYYFDSLNSRLGGMEYSLEHGGPREPYYALFTDADWETYVRGMANLARLLIPDVIRRIRLPESGARILDLGGSHGLYALACSRKSPGGIAVVMDFEPALRAAAAIHEGGPGKGIFMTAGDILTSPLPPGQDTVLMFNVLHGFDGPGSRSLIERAAETLREGGRLYILDQMTGAVGVSFLSRFLPLMVGLNLMNEIGGSAHTVARMREWCAGAASFRVMPLKFPGVTLIEAGDWRPPRRTGNGTPGA